MEGVGLDPDEVVTQRVLVRFFTKYFQAYTFSRAFTEDCVTLNFPLFEEHDYTRSHPRQASLHYNFKDQSLFTYSDQATGVLLPILGGAKLIPTPGMGPLRYQWKVSLRELLVHALEDKPDNS